MFSGCDGVIEVADADVPSSGTKLAEWTIKDRKAYATLFFLIEPNYRAPILELDSGREAFKKLVSEYEKDTSTTRMLLRQRFYTLEHDPHERIGVYIDAVFNIVRQLNSIGHKPDDLEVSDKLLIGLDRSWFPARTALTLREQSAQPDLDQITSALKQYEANENPPPIKEESRGDSAMYAKSRGGGGRDPRDKGHGQSRGRDVGEYDWGNTKDSDGACFRCGRSGHMARFCVADMPEDVKRAILRPDNAQLATISDSSYDPDQLFAFAINDNISSVTITPDDNSEGFGQRVRGGKRGGRRGIVSPEFAF